MFEDVELLVLLLRRTVVNILLFDATVPFVLDCCCIEACPVVVPNNTTTKSSATIGTFANASWFICSRLSHTIFKFFTAVKGKLFILVFKPFLTTVYTPESIRPVPTGWLTEYVHI
jgi:hypothetical protein